MHEQELFFIEEERKVPPRVGHERELGRRNLTDRVTEIVSEMR